MALSGRGSDFGVVFEHVCFEGVFEALGRERVQERGQALGVVVVEEGVFVLVDP